MLHHIRNLHHRAYKGLVYLSKGQLGARLVTQVTTPFSTLQVIDKRGYRYLVFTDEAKRPLAPEKVYQTCIPLDERSVTRHQYVDSTHLAWLFQPDIKKALMIGLGGGAVPRRLLADYPQLQITSVEIDPMVVEIAHKYFLLPQDPRHQIVIDDGRRYLDQARSQTDLVLMDAFFSESIPYQLYTRECYQAIRRHLRPNGVLGMNINGAISGPKSTLFRCIYQTLCTAFPEVHLFAAKKESPDQMQNLMVFAINGSPRLTPREIAQRAHSLTTPTVDYTRYAQGLFSGPIDLSTAQVLTDASAPSGGQLNLQ